MVNGERLRFDLMGLYKGVFLMRDRGTGSVWAHLDGFASQGPLAGERLRFVALPQMTWGEWRSLHPDTLVLDYNTQWKQQYGVPSGDGGSDPTLARFADSRLAWDALVVGVEANSAYAGYAVDAVAAAGGYVNATLGDTPLVVLYDSSTRTGIAYSRVTPDGQVLDFVVAQSLGVALRLKDVQTGSTWDSSGTAIRGALAGTKLTYIPSFISAWYGWSAYHPQTGLFGG